MSKIDDIFEDSEELVTDGTDVWVRCKTRQSQGLIHVDYLSWSVRASSLDALTIRGLACRLAERLVAILGGEVVEGRGVHFYEHGLRIMSGKALLGAVWFGGDHQLGTVHCQIPGTGWLSGDDSMNRKLFELLQEFEVPYLSRIDLARDCFEGESDFDSMTQAYEDGFFKPSRGVMPSTWAVVDRHRGSTRYVGRRENGRCIRGYEKSMQLARVSGWFRVEVELRSVGRRVPIEAVMDPAAYFAGTCRFCADLADSSRVTKVKTRRSTVELTLSHMTDYGRIAYGPMIKFYRDAGVPDSVIVDRLTVGVTKLPRRLSVCSREKIFQTVGLALPADDLMVAL